VRREEWGEGSGYDLYGGRIQAKAAPVISGWASWGAAVGQSRVMCVLCVCVCVRVCVFKRDENEDVASFSTGNVECMC
jgi:hypothetical protein